MPALRLRHPSRARSAQRAGLTLIELMVVMAILSVVLGSVVLSMQEGSDAWTASMESSTLDSKTERTLDRIVRLLEVSSLGSLDPDLFDTGDLTSDLGFREMVGFAAGSVQLGPERRLTLVLAPGELDNDLDDNGDGLADEQRLVLTETVGGTPRSIALAKGISELLAGETANGLDDNGNGLVDEPGLCFDGTGGTLNIRLSMEKVTSRGQLMTRTLETALTLE